MSSGASAPSLLRPALGSRTASRCAANVGLTPPQPASHHTVLCAPAAPPARPWPGRRTATQRSAAAACEGRSCSCPAQGQAQRGGALVSSGMVGSRGAIHCAIGRKLSSQPCHCLRQESRMRRPPKQQLTALHSHCTAEMEMAPSTVPGRMGSPWPCTQCGTRHTIGDMPACGRGGRVATPCSRLCCCGSWPG